MGNGPCCHIPRHATRKNSPVDDYTFDGIKHQDNHYPRSMSLSSSTVYIISPELVLQQNMEYPTHKGPDHLLEPADLLGREVIANEKNTICETAVNFASGPDVSSDDAISVYQQYHFADPLCGINDGLWSRVQSQENYQQNIRSSQVQAIKVMGAGNPAVNGVYRWFTKHEHFVMFTDDCQYQIVGGVNLSDYGDRYNDCWAIEEIMGNVVLLYAVASNEDSSIACDGWICICGTSPAPKIQIAEECGFYEDEDDIETEGSDTSISLMATSFMLKQWATDNFDPVQELQ